MFKDKLRRKVIISCCDQKEYEETYKAVYDQLKGLDCYKEGKIEVNCQFCNKKWFYLKNKIKIKKKIEKMYLYLRFGN